VARLKPRFNADVNKWWICDAGRYGFKWIDDKSRLAQPLHRIGAEATEVSWDHALPELVRTLGNTRPEEIGILASPQMSNEDLWVLRRLAAELGVRNLDFRVPPRTVGDEDGFLIRGDKNPNGRGAELIGIAPGQGGLDAAGMLSAAREKRLKLLWIFHHDLWASAWPEAEVLSALEGAGNVVFQGTNANEASARAHLVLPTAAYVEREGTFTNFEGRVQRFRTALEPPGEAWPDWMILSFVGKALGFKDPVFAAERSEQVFSALASAVPAFAGMTYRGIGDAGAAVKS
jgi:NADH-quinone oxidoreductase subunit G